ncbi:MAG TPA: archaeosortase/exosortase family protein [Candidatus Methanofastidiosa archaeon]|nr:archaeosortase/exosortase family protein [Candidatus Methanofastidiosa archaeon]
MFFIYFIILMVLWEIAVIFLYKKRQWLLYYLIAAFGLTFLIILVTQHIGFDTLLSEIEVGQTSTLLNWVNIDAYSQGVNLMIPTQEGWAVLICTLECSALMELAVFFSLLLFYFKFSAARKVLSIVIGLLVTYVANILRLFTISVVANRFGEDYVFMAHTVVGRLLFFGFVLVIYWFLVTRPTISYVGKSLIEDAIADQEGGETG